MLKYLTFISPFLFLLPTCPSNSISPSSSSNADHPAKSTGRLPGSSEEGQPSSSARRKCEIWLIDLSINSLPFQFPNTKQRRENKEEKLRDGETGDFSEAFMAKERTF